MALEKTVLDGSIITILLKKHYDIAVHGCQRLALGSANCYRVSDGKRNYFLKEFQTSISEDAVNREAELLKTLSKEHIPVSGYIQTNTGEWLFNFNNHIICLQEYIEGLTCGYNNFPSRLLPSLAQMLGKIHTALKNYDLPVDMGKEWLESYSAKKLITQYDALIKSAQAQDDADSGKIIEDLEYKKELALRCNEYKKFYDGITYTSTHGDYQGCQTIYTETDIKAVIDFSSAAKLPAVWEVMRSYVQSSHKSAKNAAFDIDGLCAYVKEYMKYAALTDKDIYAMPYVYLFQLARSKFGYSQYLNMKSEDSKALLEFGIWRTDMCRFVENNLENISQILTTTRV